MGRPSTGGRKEAVCRDSAKKKRIRGEKKLRKEQEELAAIQAFYVGSPSPTVPYCCPVWPVTDAPNAASKATQVDSSPLLTRHLTSGLAAHNVSFERGKRCLEMTGQFGGPLHTYLETEWGLHVCCNDAFRRAHFHHFADDIERMESICGTWTGDPAARFEYVCSSPPYDRQGEFHNQKAIVLAGVALATKMAVFRVTAQHLAKYAVEEQPSFQIMMNQRVENYPDKEHGMFAECWAVWVK